MRKINVFISSTCYDLAQIRADLKDFIIELGYSPILSEEYNFPVDSSKTTVENCIDAVKNHADIFVLIIGNRYGSELDSGKSITNEEFSAALLKGIPIYTFTLKQMLHILPIWDANKEGDYSNCTDNIQVFKFIKDVRENNKIWNFPFENANDIKITLREQLSFLFQQSLQTKNKIENLGNPEVMDNLSSSSLKILLEKKEFYEISFFFNVCKDEILKYQDIKRDYLYSIIIQPSRKTNSFSEYLEWSDFQLSRLSELIKSLNILINKVFKDYYGEPGVPSDIRGLYYTAYSYGRIYKSLLEWNIDVKSLIVDDQYLSTKLALSNLSEDSIKGIENLPDRALKDLDQVIFKIQNGEKNIRVETNLTLEIPDSDMLYYNTELSKLMKLAKRKII